MLPPKFRIELKAPPKNTSKALSHRPNLQNDLNEPDSNDSVCAPQKSGENPAPLPSAVMLYAVGARPPDINCFEPIE
jgi:hypothetical protein